MHKSAAEWRSYTCKNTALEKSNFVDQIRIFCRSGHGGAGNKHFMRNKLTAMGGPDGGDGGRGAHIVLRGNSNLWTLLHLRYFKNVLAEDGEKGGANNCHGRNGKDIIIEVPLGTIARLAGKTVKENNKAAPRANATVIAIGRIILPSTPSSAIRGK